MQHIPSTALRDARLELHYAAQVVAACADAWLPIRADDGHTAMEWERPRMIGALSPSGIAIGVDLEAFAIIGFDARRQDVSLPLAGKTLVQALLWADSRYGTPRTGDTRVPALPAGTWRTDEWSGAVLTSTEVGDDAAKAREFVVAALAALR